MFAKIDIMFFKWTRKISFVLNWITGKEPREFFDLIVLVPFLIVMTGIIDPERGAWIWPLALLYVIIVLFSYFEKLCIEQLRDHPAKYRFSRVLWGVFFIYGVCMLPFKDILVSAPPMLVYFLLCYCKYCYLHDIPPRDSVFARAKKAIKGKLGSFSLAPSPA